VYVVRRANHPRWLLSGPRQTARKGWMTGPLTGTVTRETARPPRTPASDIAYPREPTSTRDSPRSGLSRFSVCEPTCRSRFPVGHSPVTFIRGSIYLRRTVTGPLPIRESVTGVGSARMAIYPSPGCFLMFHWCSMADLTIGSQMVSTWSADICSRASTPYCSLSASPASASASSISDSGCSLRS
jgi:hypothetical protein